MEGAKLKAKRKLQNYFNVKHKCYSSPIRYASYLNSDILGEWEGAKLYIQAQKFSFCHYSGCGPDAHSLNTASTCFS